jgi:predicted nucleic acid-binding protein
MRAILDTSVVIAADVAPLDGDLAISAVTLAELHFGVLVARTHGGRTERLRRLMLLQKVFHALPIDDAAASSYGQIAAAIASPRPRSMDLLIADTARTHDARLYTRNAANFRGLEELIDIVPV